MVREVQLARANPVSDLTLAFDAKVSFGHKFAEIHLAPGSANLPLKGADPRLHSTLRGLLTDAGRSSDSAGPLLRSVREAIRPLLAKGESPRIAQVARALGMSTRTIQRRLNAQGWDFEETVDSLRQETALRLIQDTRRSLLSMSLELGFADERSLARAFRRWTGRSPSDYRARLQENVEVCKGDTR